MNVCNMPAVVAVAVAVAVAAVVAVFPESRRFFLQRADLK